MYESLLSSALYLPVGKRRRMSVTMDKPNCNGVPVDMNTHIF
jgi:hypothetical protein